MPSTLHWWGCSTDGNFHQYQTNLQSLWPYMVVEQPTIYQEPASWKYLAFCSYFVQWVYPTKVLRFLKCLREACITDRTFYLYQAQCLEPSALSEWSTKQKQLLSTCELPLTIGGDGRADSPGHSAKYGSYGIIDVRTQKVLHVELVQVCTYSNAFTLYTWVYYNKIP